MALLNNMLTLLAGRGVVGVGSRSHILGIERVPRRHDGLLLACTHLSHYDPFTISVLLRREVDWMARAEFFSSGPGRLLMKQTGAFRVDRAGPWLPGVREALRRLDRGRLVGIFPEGEVMRDKGSVLLGGSLKQGAALLARRANVPLVPCVSLGSDQFRSVMPWLPLRVGELWVGFGEPLTADPSVPLGRPSRRELTTRLEVALRGLCAEMLATFEVAEHARVNPGPVLTA